MAGAFSFVVCPKCGEKGTAKVRSSRQITKNFTEYYLRCSHCDGKIKGFYSVESHIWPSKLWDEDKIRSEFKPWQVVENIFEIHQAYKARTKDAKAEIARLKTALKAAKDEVENIERTYNLLLDIGHEASAKQRI
ncbi:ogr/Delta-like zinc finger family protein [Chromobacterium vaccinii]|uniref:ogr/Delta-like zinc finger family protein n=1 Tax=Chromobacterium vaccinii TaxID=1108595 RepID=UPI003C733DA5